MIHPTGYSYPAPVLFQHDNFVYAWSVSIQGKALYLNSVHRLCKPGLAF